MVFPLVMYGCKRRLSANELMLLKGLLRVPWTVGRSVNPNGNQSWIFIERTDAIAETPIPWPPDAKICLIRKDPVAGKDWRQKENGTTENEMVRWHYWLNGHEFEQAPGYGEGRGGLPCCNPWGYKELYMTEWLNNNSSIYKSSPIHSFLNI